MIYSCLICGHSFNAAPAAKRKYCSNACYAIARSRQVERICETCDRPFLAKKHKIDAGKGRFCSRACADYGWDEPCEMCGKLVHRTPHHARTQQHVFCSRECYKAFRSEKIKRICEQCGKTFFAKPSKATNGRGRFCSNACYHASRFAGMSTFICQQCGKEFQIRTGFVSSHMFKGIYCSSECMGVARRLPSSNAAAYSFEFTEELKESTRARDYRQCQLCGLPESDSARKLAVHHIDYDKTNNHPSNLISLCHSCHSKTNSRHEYWRQYFAQATVLRCNGLKSATGAHGYVELN